MTFVKGNLCELRVLQETEHEVKTFTDGIMAGLDHMRHLFTGSIPMRYIDVKEAWEKERKAGSVQFGIWILDREVTNKRQLPTRARSVLCRVFGDDMLTPERVSQVPEEKLLEIPNCGKTTVREIKSWLWDRGYPKCEDSFIGTCGLFSHKDVYRSWEFRILIFDADAVGKGIGTEATQLTVDFVFNRLNAHRVWLGCSAANDPAIKCYQKVGFKEEGRLRDEIFTHGKYHDAIRMSILENEWREDWGK